MRRLWFLCLLPWLPGCDLEAELAETLAREDQPEPAPDDQGDPGPVEDIEEVAPDVNDVIVDGIDWIDVHTLPEANARWQRARAVALVKLVRVEQGRFVSSRCTGWLVGRSLIITNYHCIGSPDALLTAYANFDYLHPDDYDSDDALVEDAFACNEVALSSAPHDLAVLRCAAHPDTGAMPSDHVGTWLELADRAPIAEEPIYLLHQNCAYTPGVNRCTFNDTPPGEAVKKLSPGRVGTVARAAYTVEGNRIAAGTGMTHNADTLGGTSGAPVLDAEHRVLALHHSGNPATQENSALRFDVILRQLPLAELIAADQPDRCDDRDGDGYGAGCAAGPDCDDTNPARHPGAREICNSGIDEDCDGEDERCPDLCPRGTFQADAGHCLRCDGDRWTDTGVLPADTPCRRFECDPVVGLRAHNLPNGTPCGDGRCDAGQCVQAPACDGPLAQDCGRCGHQTRTCTAGRLSPWGLCEDEGVCVPGSERVCGRGGAQTCTAACTWGDCAEVCVDNACAVRFRAGNTRIVEVDQTAFHLHDGTPLGRVASEGNVCVIGWALGQWHFHHQPFAVRDENGDGWIDIPLPALPVGLAPFWGCPDCRGRLPYRFNLRRCADDLIAVGHYANLEAPWGPKTGDFAWSGRDDLCTPTGSLSVSFDGVNYYASGAAASPLACE